MKTQRHVSAYEREREPARTGLLFVRNEALERAYTAAVSPAPVATVVE